MRFVTCFPERLYAEGGFYDSEHPLEGMATLVSVQPDAEWLGQMYPAFVRERRHPSRVWGPDQAANLALLQYYDVVGAQFTRGAASGLVRLPRAYLHQSVVHVPDGEGLAVVYESYRQNDRTAVAALPTRDRRPQADRVFDETGRQCIYLGSAGSFNYGHFLVDDLPRLVGLPGPDALILLDSFGAQIDRVRLDGLRRFTSATVEFIDRLQTIECGDLLYVTPATYHPMLKSPDAMAFIRRHLAADAGPAPTRLLVLRRSASRSLLNASEVAAQLAQFGFQVVYPEELTFDEQVTTFHEAECVVGVMGAAMTNTLFSLSAAKIVHLAPNGWVEPFYWDLAEVVGQNYSVLFGMAEDLSVPSHLSSFTIDLSRLSVLMGDLLGKE